MRVAAQIDDLYHEIASRQGLSDSAYIILGTIAMLGDGCTQAEIYQCNYLNKQTVNSSVKRLRDDGLIRCESGSGREIKFFLTPKGVELVNKKILPFEQAENEIFESMSPQEQSEFLRLINLYLETFRQKADAIFASEGTNA